MLSPVGIRNILAAVLLWLTCTLAHAQPLATASQVAIPALDSPVVDTTGTLDAIARQNIEAQARALQQRKGSQLQVLVVPTTQPEDIAQYAVRAFEQWKLGRNGVDDGVLLVVAKDDRRVHIEVGYGLEGAIPDATAFRVIQEYLVPKFRANDYAGGITDATAALVKLVDGEPLPAPMVEQRPQGGSGDGWLFALVAAFIVAQVARGISGRAPSLLRGVIGAGAAGGVAWLISSLLLVGGIGAAIGFFMGLASLPSGRFARGAGGGVGSWGGFGGPGGGWGGGMGGGGFGGGGGGGGGGWSGGGGMSGGGGASGSW